MIYDPATDTVMGNLGWVDRGDLWLYSPSRGNEHRISVEGAEYLSVKPGLNGLFRLVHHRTGKVSASVRPFANPDLELATMLFVEGRPVLRGDLERWLEVDAAMIVQAPAGPRLIRVNVSRGEAVDLDLSWFNSDTYDLGYQGLVDCLSLPDLGLVVVSVQRSSELVLIDVEDNRRVDSVMLAGRGGNPLLTARSEREFAASDYDCLCLVSTKTRSAKVSRPLQAGTSGLTQQFIGDYYLADDRCAVARPFSGDVVLLDLNTFEVRNRAPVVGQPLALCMISPSDFVTRDWKTGAAAVGQFPH